MKVLGGRYQIIRTLGEGALGTTYLAKDLNTQRQVALKEIEGIRGGSKSALMHTTTAIAGINHPNIAQIYDIQQEGSSYYIVSEFVEGKTLRQCIQAGTVGTLEALNVATQVAEALEHAHQAGVVHCDLRPENILLDSKGQVKLTDFGMSRILRANQTVTKSGVVVNNLEYMSPEQLMGHQIDARSDLWSLGVMLYEMTVHQLPFKRDSLASTTNAILKQAPPLEKIRDSELKEIVSKALEKPMENRYQSAGAMVSDLEELLPEAIDPPDNTGGGGDSGIFGNLWSRLNEGNASDTQRAPSITASDNQDDSPVELYINLWIEDGYSLPVDLLTVLSAGSTYTFLFAIENFSREDHGKASEFVEPAELSKQPITPVVIELLCAFLKTEDDSGYVRREVDYFAGDGFPAERFTLEPKEAGQFYLTARLLIKGETIYREVLTLEVATDKGLTLEVAEYVGTTQSSELNNV